MLTDPARCTHRHQPTGKPVRLLEPVDGNWALVQFPVDPLGPSWVLAGDLSDLPRNADLRCYFPLIGGGV